MDNSPRCMHLILNQPSSYRYWGEAAEMDDIYRREIGQRDGDGGRHARAGESRFGVRAGIGFGADLSRSVILATPICSRSHMAN
jgi:hypothetical protein